MIKGTYFALEDGCSIHDVIKNMNASQLQVCFIMNPDGSLTGSITDGDIRRGLINGFSLEDNATGIMQSQPISVSIESSAFAAQQLMQKNNIKQLPIINKDLKLVGVYLLDQLNQGIKVDNTIVIMAGGFGKRMMPLTESLPKPMIKIDGKPILEHILLNARKQGFRNFIISVHYLSEIIIDYFGNGSHLDISIEYIKEDEPLGTAGSMSLIESIPELPLIVTNGDLVTDIDYKKLIDFHQNNSSDATMAIKRHEIQNPYGVVVTDGLNITDFEEKPIHLSNINAGVYVLNSKLINKLNKNEYCDMPNFFMTLKADQYKVTAFPIHEIWADLGKPVDIANASSLKKEN
jgi:dTDP-glucose pyrophosphorylase